MTGDDGQPDKLDGARAALGCLLIVGLGACGWLAITAMIAVVAWIVSIFS